jgi:L-proline amide hydrolase
MANPLPANEGLIKFRGYNVWYRVVGEREQPGRLPLVCLHGGPGATHDYLAPLEDLASARRRVVLYDQLGWGNSDHVHDESLWSLDLFVEELTVLLSSLSLERVHLLGHSWGGMLALEYALRQPARLASLVVVSATASSPQWAEQAAILVSQLPAEIQETMRKHESAGTPDSPEYQEACREFSRRHGGRHVNPKPEWFEKAMQKLGDNEIYLTMWGPSEFCVTGRLKDWDVTTRLGEIHLPTLVMTGRHDEATPALAETLHHGIRGSECVIFEKSAHFSHVEETERFLAVLEQFLDSVETRAA